MHSHKQTIGFLAAGLDEPYQISVLDGLLAGLDTKNTLLVCLPGIPKFFDHVHHADTPLTQELATKNSFDILIVLSSTFSGYLAPGELENFFKGFYGIPIISVGQKIDGYPSVCIDNRTGMDQLCEHLFTVHGYARPAFIGGPPGHPEADERETVFRQALKRHAKKTDEDLIIHAGFDFGNAERETKKILGMKKTIDCVICASDSMAMETKAVLESHGIAVPQNCGLTGFDDIPTAAVAPFELTTVHQPLREMGQLAAGIALQVLGNSRASDQTLQTNLVIRSSCGCRITPSKTFEATNQMPDAVRKRHQQKREHHLRMIGVRLLGASDDQDIKSILHEGLSNLETGRVTVCIIPETSRGSSAKKAVVFYDYQNPASRKILSEKEFLLDRVFPPDYDTEDANFLVCPLNFGNENLGYIIFEHDPEILEVYYILSLQLGNAVKVWELEKKRRDYTDNLKHLVETRTEELLVEARLRQKAESEILAAAEREQRRIGQDLHDDICQRLAAISILAGALERMNSDKSLANSASVISERIRDVIEKTKSLSRGLFPVVLEKQGLCGALEELCSIQKKLSALPCDFIHEEKNGRYEPSRETSLHLYRIAQEAVNNAVHHGGGPITVTLSESSESLVLSIRDQGKGFLPDTPSGMGLPSMKHRSLLIQAKLIIESCANGTTVECSLEKRGMQK